MPGELEYLLGLVADGKLSAEEAAPLVAALQDAGSEPRPGDAAKAAKARAKAARRNGWNEPGGGPGPAEQALSGKRLRIMVAEGGRSLVNLQMPVAGAGYAIDRIPGLSPDVRARIVDAIQRGMTGPIVEVRDDEDEVRIVIE